MKQYRPLEAQPPQISAARALAAGINWTAEREFGLVLACSERDGLVKERYVRHGKRLV